MKAPILGHWELSIKMSTGCALSCRIAAKGFVIGTKTNSSQPRINWNTGALAKVAKIVILNPGLAFLMSAIKAEANNASPIAANTQIPILWNDSGFARFERNSPIKSSKGTPIQRSSARKSPLPRSMLALATTYFHPLILYALLINLFRIIFVYPIVFARSNQAKGVLRPYLN